MSRPTCDECGQVHERCIRHNRSGAPCGNWPKRGTTVCTAPSHGGRLPRVKAAAERTVVEEEARLAFGRFGDHARPVDNPLEALATAAGEVVAWKDYCAGWIAELSELRTLDDKGAEQINALVALFERSMNRAVSTLSTVAKLGIEEKLARISQQQADQFFDAFAAGLAAAGVSGTRAEEARAAAARNLRHMRSVS